MQGLVGESHKALTDDLPHCQPTQHRLHMTAICTSLPGRRVRHRERPRAQAGVEASLHPEVERLLREAREDRERRPPFLAAGIQRPFLGPGARRRLALVNALPRAGKGGRTAR